MGNGRIRCQRRRAAPLVGRLILGDLERDHDPAALGRQPLEPVSILSRFRQQDAAVFGHERAAGRLHGKMAAALQDQAGVFPFATASNAEHSLPQTSDELPELVVPWRMIPCGHFAHRVMRGHGSRNQQQHRLAFVSELVA